MPRKISNKKGSFQMPLMHLRQFKRLKKPDITSVLFSSSSSSLFIIHNNLFLAARQQKSLHNKVSISQRAETSFSGKLLARFPIDLFYVH